MDKEIKSENELLPNTDSVIKEEFSLTVKQEVTGNEFLELQTISEALYRNDTEEELFMAAQNEEVSCIESLDLEEKSQALFHECDIKCEDYSISGILTEEVHIKTENIDNHEDKILIKPNDSKLLHCNVCGYKCKWLCTLDIHMKIHTGEKPFQCNICNAKFTQKSCLKPHIKTHTGEKPFQCNICDAKFTQQSNLKQHFQTHTSEKPFQCNICDTRFAHKNSLKRHILSHTGEKPFQCNICNTKFKRKSYLKKHLKNTHSTNQNGNLGRRIRIHTSQHTHLSPATLISN